MEKKHSNSQNSIMPALFVGHGSPMNIVADNAYTQSLGSLGEKLPRPDAILVVSAHWETPGLQILRVAEPRTIYDFGGFPKELYAVRYQAPGAPELARRIIDTFPTWGIKGNDDWGLDHGAWAVLKHLFPKADIPVLPLSLSKQMSAAEHLRLAEDLRILREQGVMILGSGNVTHNLGDLDWENPMAAPFPWAKQFDDEIAKALKARDRACLLGERPELAALFKQAHPRREHFLPLLYVFGASYEHERPEFIYEGFEHGSLSMRCFLYQS